MSTTAVSITKSTSFRGVAQLFSNTYHYETPLPVSAGQADGLIDAVVAKERPMHGSNVTFVRGRAWSAGGTKAENEMLAQKPLTGTGSATGAGSTMAFDKERAFLVRFRAGNDSRGRPVYLRKWWHLDVDAIGTIQVSAQQLQQTSQLNSTQRAALVTAADGFKSITVGAQNFDLVSSKGRDITGATEAHPWIEHHQLGDMWRG